MQPHIDYNHIKTTCVYLTKMHGNLATEKVNLLEKQNSGSFYIDFVLAQYS